MFLVTFTYENYMIYTYFINLVEAIIGYKKVSSNMQRIAYSSSGFRR